MNVTEFFGKASEVVARNDASALVIGRITMIVLGIVAIIGLLMIIIWLVNRCVGARPMNFEHYDNAPTDWETTKYVPFLQAKLTYLTKMKTEIGKMSEVIYDVEDSLDAGKENICSATESIRDDYINARMSGIDPNLATESKETQAKRLAARKARAENDWKRRQATFKAKSHKNLVECFDAKTSTSVSIIIQISTTCDDIMDTINNLNEFFRSPEFGDVITHYYAIEGSIEFTTPFIVNNAIIVGNNVSTIRNMPKPDVSAQTSTGTTTATASATTVTPASKTDTKASTTDTKDAPATADTTTDAKDASVTADASATANTTTEGFDDPDPELYYKTNNPDVAAKEASTIETASNFISGLPRFKGAIDMLVNKTKNSVDVIKKTKLTTKDLKDGKIMPAYLDKK